MINPYLTDENTKTSTGNLSHFPKVAKPQSIGVRIWMAAEWPKNPKFLVNCHKLSDFDREGGRPEQ